MKTHTSDPVLCTLRQQNREEKDGISYSEAEAKKTRKLLEKGHELIWHLLEE